MFRVLHGCWVLLPFCVTYPTGLVLVVDDALLTCSMLDLVFYLLCRQSDEENVTFRNKYCFVCYSNVDWDVIDFSIKIFAQIFEQIGI